MSMLSQFRRVTQKLWVSGVRLRCPNCEQGHIFIDLFKIEKQCDVCNVKFERMDGESIGGMAITMAIVPPLSIIGYFVTAAFTEVTFAVNVTIWTIFIILACVWIYRHSRATWVAISYLTGGVYADEPEPNTDKERAILIEAVRKSNPHNNEQA